MKRARVYRIMLLLGSAVAALALGEAALRIIARNAPQWLFNEYQDPFWEIDFMRSHAEEGTFQGSLHVRHPTRGWTPGPNRCVTWQGYTHTTNDRGHRSVKPFVAAADKYTVLVAGDSFTFGHGANDADVWPAMLEGLDDRLQVVNLGVAGYAADQICITLEESIPEYRPQLAIFAYIHDDLERSWLSFREYHKPRFVLEGDELKLTNTPIGTPAETLRELRREYGWPSLMTWRVLRERIADLSRDKENTFLLNERIVQRAMACAEEHGCEFLLVHLACDEQITDPRCEDQGEQFLRYFISRHEVAYLATREKFLEQGSRWNIGHYQRPEAKVVAEAVYQKITGLQSWRSFVNSSVEDGPNTGSRRDRSPVSSAASRPSHSTVTLLARLRGLSTSQPRATAMW